MFKKIKPTVVERKDVIIATRFILVNFIAALDVTFQK